MEAPSGATGTTTVSDAVMMCESRHGHREYLDCLVVDDEEKMPSMFCCEKMCEWSDVVTLPHTTSQTLIGCQSSKTEALGIEVTARYRGTRLR